MVVYSKEIEISACRPEDCGPAAALGKSVWGDWSNGPPLARQFIDMGHPVFVARNPKGEIVGYCSGLCESDGKTGYVLSITIHPDYRKINLGSRLAQSVVDVFRSRKAASVNTVVSDDNHASKTLFTKLGFRETKKMQNYYEAGDMYCLFTLTLE